MSPQQCSYCTRSFNRAEHLLRHVRSHTKEKPFKCEGCGKGYAREDTLIRHAKSHCVGRRRRMTLSEGMNVGENTAMRDEGPPPNENTIMSSPSDVAISGSTPAYHAADFNIGSNPWDFNPLGFMDDNPLWTINSGFFNEINGTEAPVHLHDIDLDDAEYFGNMHSGDNQNQLRTSSTDALATMDLRDIWFTKIKRSAEKQNHPPHPLARISGSRSAASPSEPEIVDEECWRGLSKALIPSVPYQDFLPSSEFLNLCVRRYLKCFNPIFPILHAATFQPTPENGLLLISMASIGCLFLGSQNAVQRGRILFEGLNKVILMSNDSTRHTSAEVTAMAQAAIIGQTFAMLSGDGRHFAIFDSYHGSMIAFARRENMFDGRHAVRLLEDLSEEELDVAWREWIREEEFMRIGPALKIHDAELSLLLHRDSLIKRSEHQGLATQRAFKATTALEWASALRMEREAQVTTNENACKTTPREPFTAYLALERLGVTIAEARRQERLDATTTNGYQEALQRWYEAYMEILAEGELDRLCLIPLWHSTFMSSLVDMDKLESAIGRDGQEQAKGAIQYVSAWASTPDAARCVMHAFLLQRNLQSLHFDEIPAIHVPRITFSAAIAWHCYIMYGPGNNPLDSSMSLFDTGLPEFRVMTASNLSQLSSISKLTWNRGATSSIKAATLCELGGQLQRMNEWGLAGKFSTVVARLIDGEA